MTRSRRIILNTAATYGRTLFALALGLFSSRWVLLGLGKDDFGLLGVVGGILVFIGLLNSLLSSSVARYYAYAIGEVRTADLKEANDRLIHWFNAAISIHFILPTLLIVCGYPIGLYAIRHWLTIPDGRLQACVWVFRISLFSSFMHMISVPYIAMYQAKQLIAELSLWGIVTTVSNFLIAYYMLSCSSDRLVTYAFLSAITPSVILAIQILRARKHFGVCHIKLQYLFEWPYLKKIFGFAFWDFFGWIGATVRDNGSVFVINRNCGAGINAAYSLAQRVIGYTTSLSSALIGALQPAITTTVGEHDFVGAKKLAYRCCKFSTLLILLFAIPLIVEMDEVLCLWLKSPPEYTAQFCRWILAALIVQKLAWGHHMAVCAVGKIVAFQITLGTTAALGLFGLMIFFWMGCGPESVGYMVFVVFSIMTIERVLFARGLIAMSVRYWLLHIVIPVMIVVVGTFFLAFWVASLLDPSIWRIILTSSASCLSVAVLSVVFALDAEERDYILHKMGAKVLPIFTLKRTESSD